MMESRQLELVIKDLGEIHSRLFDHHPFLSGEIKFFQREFEEKRGDRDVERLFNILERVTEIRETQVDRAAVLADQQLCNVTANLEVALRMCSKIVEQEVKEKDDVLSERRAMRQQEWLNFTKDMVDKQTRVDRTFLEKDQQLAAYYGELEQKLHISTPPPSV